MLRREANKIRSQNGKEELKDVEWTNS
jgi:hypothetical protein